ncbi:MAG: hypothetical protein CBC12_05740 [Candidatus Puniceispirillum sp. TMED52]|nr:hypothetical protein [SAR116 cluster bacterium]OUU50425.1 MAG: hypothetical protein CBC12_05740 [Candidatus Puniceispirillum sp. TMED52]HCP18150.1 hypothetical protein [Alphaproteobacteria bacterium]|tara:strand:- start:220 stop:684 length:465 start_codon:yes stop_codon:yes gene_type:complete
MRIYLSSLIIAFSLILAGCTSIERLHSPEVTELGQISLKVASSRSDQIFSQQLYRYLNRHQAQDIRYYLTTSISKTKSDSSVSMTLKYNLYDQTKGKILLADTINQSATFGAVSSLYGQDKAATFASERLATQLADKLYLKILAYFNNKENTGE